MDLAGFTGSLDGAGLPVTEVPMAPSPAQFRSLLRGGVDVALTSSHDVPADRGSPGGLPDGRMDAPVDRGMRLGLDGRSRLTLPDGLRWARVAAYDPVSGSARAQYALADSLGAPHDDYQIVIQGSTPRRLQALLTGDSDESAPYLFTVFAVVDKVRLKLATRPADCSVRTAAAVVFGELDWEAAASTARRLHLDPVLPALEDPGFMHSATGR